MAEPSVDLAALSPDDPSPGPQPTGPQLTVRAVVTGAVLGSVLAVANIYTGLKIGWGFNMSVAAVLLSFGFWGAMRAAFGTRPWGILENNVNQAGASAAASISSAGLVSSVPALMLLEPGYHWSFGALALWMGCCSLLGVFVAVLFRRQMLVVERLPFPSGIATAATLREMYARGAQAASRVAALVGATVVAAGWKVVIQLAPVKAMPIAAGFALDPSLLQLGAGAIIGPRVGAWMMVGSLLAWVVIAPALTASGLVAAGPNAAREQGEWLLWPGVAMMVTASLTSLAFSGKAFLAVFTRRARAERGDDAHAAPEPPGYDVPPRTLWLAIAVTAVVTIVAGYALFDMHPLIGLVAVLLTLVLAVVALRVAGETNVTPIGPMGKVTQLSFGALDPGHVTTNLMAASVTGGSAAQAADMMQDLKTGLMLGAAPRAQAVSQLVGVVCGALAGSGVYLFLIQSIGPKLAAHDPEWKAPAVAQWGAVARLFRDGIENMPAGTGQAIIIAALAGIALAVLEKRAEGRTPHGAPRRGRRWVPSPAALGIAFIIAPSTALSFFLGGLIAWACTRWLASPWQRFGIIIASGLVAGESLAGATFAVVESVRGVAGP
ncbi:MAG: OPT family oligopeptide transporter [Myxococcota bacterium]